jgi:diguanylate cyclase (GGDEF)-like protein
MQTQTATPLSLTPDSSERLVYLVHDNGLVARDIAVQLRYFGYHVIRINGMPQLEGAVDERPPAAVIIDVSAPASIFPAADEVVRINRRNRRRFAVIFISAHSSFGTRLAAARAGAGGYFANPLNMVALSERLDALTTQEENLPYRVLVINGDLDAADSYAEILGGAGMEVTVLRKVADMLQVLRKLKPELVLMDVQRPLYDGADLAKLIRQDDSFLDVPIVFLSDEASVAKHLDAVESGADDFLAKPIQPVNLISLLTSRAQRYRALRSLITRDGLTGLLNHSALKEQIGREIVRARRNGSPLALAMIDIDLFKRINDSYGHPAGDSVIRVLARLLQQRLRRGDIIGRYGGEEFAVVMPATQAAAAANALDSVRTAFSDIRHYSDEQEFTVTFSGGVAELAAHADADALLAAADELLYVAKRNGRNRIVSQAIAAQEPTYLLGWQAAN